LFGTMLGRDALLIDDRDDPARRGAGRDFLHRIHDAGDRRAVDRHCRFHSPILSIAESFRQFEISRLERLHAVTNGSGMKLFRNRSSGYQGIVKQ